jgi:hypothetical protein
VDERYRQRQADGEAEKRRLEERNAIRELERRDAVTRREAQRAHRAAQVLFKQQRDAERVQLLKMRREAVVDEVRRMQTEHSHERAVTMDRIARSQMHNAEGVDLRGTSLSEGAVGDGHGGGGGGGGGGGHGDSGRGAPGKSPRRPPVMPRGTRATRARERMHRPAGSMDHDEEESPRLKDKIGARMRHLSELLGEVERLAAS